jgi:hypothetical protein
LGLRIPYLSPPASSTGDKEKKNWMTTPQSTTQYDPFSVKPLQVRTRRIFAPSGGSISLTTACFLIATWSACFYLLVPLEYIR